MHCRSPPSPSAIILSHSQTHSAILKHPQPIFNALGHLPTPSANCHRLDGLRHCPLHYHPLTFAIASFDLTLSPFTVACLLLSPSAATLSQLPPPSANCHHPQPVATTLGQSLTPSAIRRHPRPFTNTLGHSPTPSANCHHPQPIAIALMDCTISAVLASSDLCCHDLCLHPLLHHLLSDNHLFQNICNHSI